MPDSELPILFIDAPDPMAAADLALLVQEEVKARGIPLSVSVRQDSALEPGAMRAALCMGEDRPGQGVDLAGMTPEQCLMALLGLLEKCGLAGGRQGYSRDEEEEVVNRLEDLGYL